MIADRFPQLRDLSDDEKLNLADELTEMVVARREAATRATVRECLAAYQAAPDAVVSWEEVKASLRNG